MFDCVSAYKTDRLERHTNTLRKCPYLKKKKKPIATRVSVSEGKCSFHPNVDTNESITIIVS